jgi:hypothetical protein
LTKILEAKNKTKGEMFATFFTTQTPQPKYEAEPEIIDNQMVLVFISQSSGLL